MFGKKKLALSAVLLATIQLSWTIKQSACAATEVAAVALNNDGVKAINAGDYTTAIWKLESAIKIDPTYQLARENLGITYNNYGLLLQSSPSQAIVQFHKAMFLDPTNATTAANLDGIVGMMHKDPNSFKDRSDLGDQAQLSGDFVGAIVEYGAALKLKNDPDTQIKLSDAYRAGSMNTKEMQEYQTASNSVASAQPKENGSKSTVVATSEIDSQPNSPFESYAYPLIKWKPKLVPGMPGVVVQLTTTLDNSNFQNCVRYIVRLFKAPVPVSLNFQFVDKNDFALATEEVSSYDFHAIPGTEVMEAKGAWPGYRSQLVDEYKRVSDYSIIKAEVSIGGRISKKRTMPSSFHIF